MIDYGSNEAFGHGDFLILDVNLNLTHYDTPNYNMGRTT